MGTIVIILLTILNIWLTIISIFKTYVIKYKYDNGYRKNNETYEEKVKCTVLMAGLLIILSVIPVVGLLSLLRYLYLYLNVDDSSDVQKLKFKSILFSQI